MNVEPDGVNVLTERDNVEESLYEDTQEHAQVAMPPKVESSDGSTGVEGNLVRPKRRVVSNAGGRVITDIVKRNYQVSNDVVFTNYTELKNDMISPEYAQEIIEEIMTLSSVDMSNSLATKMVEDVIFIFFIENGASSRTSYEKVVDVYGVEFDMMTVLGTLVAHGVTPRRFTRALARRIFTFIRAPSNDALRADIVRRFTLADSEDAAIAFDGSTHIPGLPNDRLQVAHMLATRGIYENTASTKNATDRTTYDGMLTQQQMKSGAYHINGNQGAT